MSEQPGREATAVTPADVVPPSYVPPSYGATSYVPTSYVPPSYGATSYVPTPRSLLLLLFPLLLLSAATLFVWLLWAAAAVLLAGIGLLWLDLRQTTKPAALTVRRDHHRKLTLRRDNPVEIIIENQAERPLFVQVRDEVPQSFKLSSALLSGWLNGRSQLHLIYQVEPTRRGEYPFGHINLRWTSRLGLFMRQAAYPAQTGAKVYPSLLPIRQYERMARRGQMLHSGLRPLRRAGEGGEFEQLREYLPDDDYRRISWSATARHGKPITMDLTPERSQNIILMLDVGQQMLTRPLGVAHTSRLDLVLNAVLMFSYVALSSGDRVGLLLFDDQLQRYLPPRAGMGHFYTLLEALYDAQARPVEPNYGRALRYLYAQRQSRALILLLTDPTSQEAAQGLVGQLGAFYPRHLPLCVTLSDPAVLEAAQRRPYSTDLIYQRAMA
ncbi:MAG: DUF58 domain-containing protein, partial [Chloroflexota bacterium]